jgi:hypothetical protein
MKAFDCLRAAALGVLLSAASEAGAEGAGIALKAGTLGLGAEFTKSLTDKVNFRIGGNLFTYSYSGTEDDVSYDFDLKLKNFSGLVDLHPTGGAFRISGGLVSNSNKVEALSTSTGTYSIGNGNYTQAQVGVLTGKIDFKKTAPYAGIGFGNSAKGAGVGFVFDAGVVFQGAPKATLTATGTASSSATFQNDLRNEQFNLQEDLNSFKYYSVVSIGIAFKF